MKRYLLALIVSFFSLTLWGQWYQVYNFEGTVLVKENEQFRPVELDEYIGHNWVVSINHKSYLSLLAPDGDAVYTYGETPQSSIAELTNRPKPSFAARIMSVIKGVSQSDRAYVTYKDADINDRYFMHALLTPGYKGQYDISFETLKDGKPSAFFNIGDSIGLRIKNKEEFPLYIGILWVDSQGNKLDCLMHNDRLVIIPSDSTVDLLLSHITIAYPTGVDTLYLFASKDSFSLNNIADKNREWVDDSANEGPIGFCKSSITIQQ